MREYRLYMFDAGRLVWPTELYAPDDTAAIEIAEQKWVEGRKMELWEQDRQVRSWGIPDGPFQ